MLDTGYWIFTNELMVESKHIEYPETSIQDQLAPARVLMAMQWLGHRILCNYRSNHKDGGADIDKGAVYYITGNFSCKKDVNA